jgi:hypothetical protein
MPKKPGQPTKYKKSFHAVDFIAQSKQGKSLAQIAYAWDVSRDTLYEWAKKHKEFSDAIKKGREYSEAWYMNLGQSAMVGQATINGRPISFQLGVFVWMTKNIFKWSDKITTEIPKTLEEHNPASLLTDEELDNL